MEEPQNPEQTSKQSKTVMIVIIVIVVLAVAGVAALIFANPTKAPTTTQNEETGSNSQTDANNAGTTDEAGKTATIAFTSNGFSPATLTVKKGTKVTVINNSNDPVQFSSDDHPTHREDPEINMEELAPGQSGSFTVTTVGTHGFHDHLNDSKTGTLIVTE